MHPYQTRYLSPFRGTEKTRATSFFTTTFAPAALHRSRAAPELPGAKTGSTTSQSERATTTRIASGGTQARCPSCDATAGWHAGKRERCVLHQLERRHALPGRLCSTALLGRSCISTLVAGVLVAAPAPAAGADRCSQRGSA